MGQVINNYNFDLKSKKNQGDIINRQKVTGRLGYNSRDWGNNGSQ